MTEEYSVAIIEKLQALYQRAEVHRPMRIARYDAGNRLRYDVQEVAGTKKGRVELVVEKFIGGGFAGQVYRVKVAAINSPNGPLEGLEVGGVYAMKILVPPSGFSRLFRNILYWIGFQGPFQLQVNPTAARAGALWQKFFRRGAKIRFGDQSAVVDIHATFVDPDLGSCGELSEWVDGRIWRLEVDDRLDLLKRWRKGKKVDETLLGSPEYRAKFDFMKRFVALLHDIGGHEFARQYEWSTCKSQPNCLKRKETGAEQSPSLVAVDFRAGLALLPFLPMSPGDFALIIKGLKRASLVQFDRGSLKKLEQFVETHPAEFADMQAMLAELKACERVYRDAVPDVTHNLLRLFFSKRLWSTMLDSAVTGWRVKNTIDETGAEKLRRRRFLTLLVTLISPLPVLGTFIQRLIFHRQWRRHYGAMASSWNYFRQAVRARIAEKAINWHRSLRIDEHTASRMTDSPWRFMRHWPLSLLPAGLHRILTDWRYARRRLDHLFVRPVRLYFNPQLREQWLRDMVLEGRKKHILDDADAGIILSQIHEPFIQKYLKSLAVHICTLPVTQVVSVLLAVTYVALHPEMPRTQAWAIGVGIIALFQVVPISPGSLTRGLYVVYLVVRERNFKDYNIAVFLGFFKYIGYLAFPIQMAYRYPVLARFMAGHWANESVHIVPVFGESGALLEHWVFCLFYNWPLTIRRRIRKRMELRSATAKHFWHILLVAVVGTIIFGVGDYIYIQHAGYLPDLKNIWWLAGLVPMLCGAAVTLGCGGAMLWERFVGATVCGILVGIFYTAATAWLAHSNALSAQNIAAISVWRTFVFAIFATLGAIVMELKLPDPELGKI